MNNVTILVGTDPEVFVKNRITGAIASAIGLIPGTKEEPHRISEAGHAVQTDNVMAEFCVPAARSASALYADIHFCLHALNEMLPDELETAILASAQIDPKYLRNKQARTFGCDPDFNAYTLHTNVPPNAKTNLRSAGGHIHVGYDDPSFEMNLKIVQAMDLFLGLPSLILDKDTERRKMYGKAGAFRQKDYGVEYRTLSNFWIATEESVTWAFNQTHRAVQFARENDFLDEETTLNIQLAINTMDLDLACKLAKKYGIMLAYEQPQLLQLA